MPKHTPFLWIIYKITNLINGRVYIGQTTKSVKRRIIQHRCLSGPDSDMVICRAIHKHGWENFKVESLELCLSLTDANERERFWIKYYGSIVPSGYNVALGGKVGSLTPESLAKISASNHGKKRSPEAIQKMRLAKLGTHQTAATVAKRVASRAGYRHSEETKRRMSQTKKGKPLSKQHVRSLTIAHVRDKWKRVGKRQKQSDNFKKRCETDSGKAHMAKMIAARWPKQKGTQCQPL